MFNSEDLAFFAVLAQGSSLAEGARRLNITPPAVTQRLRALEARAGVRLIDRSTRQLALTDEGAMVLAHAAVVGDAIEALAEAVRSRTEIVSGHLRIAAPSGFGRAYVSPVVETFARAYPLVTVMLDLSDTPAARSLESFDVAVHIGPIGLTSAVVTTLAANQRILCASPSYLSSAEPIRSPEDLTRHRCLALRENDEDVTLWRFQDKRRRSTTVRIKPAMSTNDGTTVREWAAAGRGITVRSEWDVAEDMRKGSLERVLPNWEPPGADVVAILGSRNGRSARTTAFLSMLRAALTPVPWRRQLDG